MAIKCTNVSNVRVCPRVYLSVPIVCPGFSGLIVCLGFSGYYVHERVYVRVCPRIYLSGLIVCTGFSGY